MKSSRYILLYIEYIKTPYKFCSDKKYTSPLLFVETLDANDFYSRALFMADDEHVIVNLVGQLRVDDAVAFIEGSHQCNAEISLSWPKKRARCGMTETFYIATNRSQIMFI